MQKKTTRRRRRSAPATTRKRTRRTTRKGVLGEMFSPAGARAGGKAVMNGAIGGALGAVGDKLMTNAGMSETTKIIGLGVGGFVVAAAFKKPFAGAGMAAIAAYKVLGEVGLNENAYLQEYDYANPLEGMPPYLNENGEEYGHLAQSPMYLQQNGVDLDYNVGYYPAGFGFDSNVAQSQY